MARKSGYKVGDAVFYPAAGVGVIESQEDVFLTGNIEACFVIRILESGATIKVPLTNMETNGIRQLLDGKKVKDLYKVLSGSARTARRLATKWNGAGIGAQSECRLVHGNRRSGARPAALEVPEKFILRRSAPAADWLQSPCA